MWEDPSLLNELSESIRLASADEVFCGVLKTNAFKLAYCDIK